MNDAECKIFAIRASEDEESNDDNENAENSQSQDIEGVMDIDNLTVQDGRRRKR